MVEVRARGEAQVDDGVPNKPGDFCAIGGATITFAHFGAWDCDETDALGLTGFGLEGIVVLYFGQVGEATIGPDRTFMKESVKLNCESEILVVHVEFQLPAANATGEPRRGACLRKRVARE